jgi:head-tail adaptor
VTCRITVRGAPVGAEQRPRPDQRFRDGSRLFRILAVTERDAAGRYLLCFAREEGTT